MNMDHTGDEAPTHAGWRKGDKLKAGLRRLGYGSMSEPRHWTAGTAAPPQVPKMPTWVFTLPGFRPCLHFCMESENIRLTGFWD